MYSVPLSEFLNFFLVLFSLKKTLIIRWKIDRMIHDYRGVPQYTPTRDPSFLTLLSALLVERNFIFHCVFALRWTAPISRTFESVERTRDNRTGQSCVRQNPIDRDIESCRAIGWLIDRQATASAHALAINDNEKCKIRLLYACCTSISFFANQVRAAIAIFAISRHCDWSIVIIVVRSASLIRRIKGHAQRNNARR